MPRDDADGRLKEKWLPNGVNSRYAYFTDNTVAQEVNRSIDASKPAPSSAQYVL
jgi:sarcosine oxidase delta subunit